MKIMHIPYGSIWEMTLGLKPRTPQSLTHLACLLQFVPLILIFGRAIQERDTCIRDFSIRDYTIIY